MTIAVDMGRKATNKQTNKLLYLTNNYKRLSLELENALRIVLYQ